MYNDYFWTRSGYIKDLLHEVVPTKRKPYTHQIQITLKLIVVCCMPTHFCGALHNGNVPE